MAKTGKDALAFVTMLRDKLAPGFERENDELAAFATKSGHEGPLEPWDVAYWAEKQRRALYDFDEETLRPYFPLDRVTRASSRSPPASTGSRSSATRGARLARRRHRVERHDEGGKRLGAFYLDLFPRETKRDGAWMGGVVDRLPGTQHERENVAVIVGNVTPPRAPGSPRSSTIARSRRSSTSSGT